MSEQKMVPREPTEVMLRAAYLACDDFIDEHGDGEASNLDDGQWNEMMAKVWQVWHGDLQESLQKCANAAPPRDAQGGDYAELAQRLHDRSESPGKYDRVILVEAAAAITTLLAELAQAKRECGATREMLEDTRQDLRDLREALGVSYEPHQSLRERALDAAMYLATYITKPSKP